MEIFLIILAFLLAGIGVWGIVVPFLPGVPLVWLGMLLVGYVTHFEELSLTLVIVFFVITFFTFVLDYFMPFLGAKRYKASRNGMIGAAVGLVVGLFFGPVGFILGPFIGAFLGEISIGRDTYEALRSAKGVGLGILAGALLKLVIVFVMIGYMIAAVI